MKNAGVRRWATGITVFGVGCMASFSQPNKKPNVVVVLCDQLRSFSVGCYGNEFIKTPHMVSWA